MVSRDRWLASQAGERDYWVRTRASASELLRTTHEKAVAMEFLLANAPALFTSDSEQRPVAYEVGIGALRVGVISLLPDVARWRLVGLEPQSCVRPDLGPVLNGLFPPVESLDYLHVVGRGEEAPLRDGCCDLVVCYNVLEHVQDPRRIVAEMYRTLKPGGVALLGENCLSWAGYAKKRWLYGDSDTNHPHAFTLGRLRKLLRHTGFAILCQDAVKREWWWRVAGRFRKRLILATPAASRQGKDCAISEGICD